MNAHETSGPVGIVTEDHEPRNFDGRIAWTLLVTGTLAWLASATLVMERLHLFANPDYRTSCDINPLLSCGSVMKSWQAALFGFPNPLIGIVGYGVVVTIAMALLAGARFQRWFWISLQTGLGLSLVMLGWLWYSAIFDIGALCLYCMIVWFVALPMFFETLKRNLATGTIRLPQRASAFFQNWSFLIVGALEIIVFGTVFVVFMNAFI